MKTLIGSPGGKWNVAEKIIQLFPEHKIYTELFCGSASIFFKKKPSELEVLNDLDDYSFVLKFIRDADDRTLEKIKKLNWIPSETRFNKLKALKHQSDLQRFYKFVYLTYYSYNSQRNNYSADKGHFDINKIYRIRERLKNVKIYQQDYKTVLKKFNTKEAFHFFDPPYHIDWRNHWGISKFDLNEFIDVLGSIKGKFLVTYQIFDDYKKHFRPFYISRMKYTRIAHRGGTEETFDEYELIITNYKPVKNTNYLEMQENLLEIEYPEFVLIPDFVAISGSSVYGKPNPNDIDIVIKIPQGLFDYIYEHNRDLFDVLILKLERIFNTGKQGNKKVHIVPSTVGATFDNLPVYDLVLRPKENLEIDLINEPEFKPYYYQELRSATKEIEKQAKQSKKEDKVEFGRFFYPEKTNLTAVMFLPKTEKFSVEKVKEWIDKNDAWNNCFAQKKYDGNRIIIFYSKSGESKFYSDDGREISHRKFPHLLKVLNNTDCETAIFDCEYEMWENGKKYNREDVAGYLHNKTDFDDKFGIANIFDLLYLNGEDIHKENLESRIEKLFKIAKNKDGVTSTINIPDTDNFKVNLTPTYLLTRKNIETILRELSFSPASEGAMIKLNTSYSLQGYANSWLKFKKYETLRAIVLEVKPTKVAGVYNYEVGVSLNEPENFDDIVELNGKEYVHIGRTYSTKIKAKVGDILSLYFHTLNLYRQKNGKYRAHIYEPIVEELHPEEKTPDNIKDVIEKAKISNLLVEKYIEDLENYNPVEVETKVLLDDFRILNAWLSSNIKKYSKDLIIQKLREVIREMIKRNIEFHPENYKVEIVKQLVQEELENARKE
jgi:DNA adenine methylase